MSSEGPAAVFSIDKHPWPQETQVNAYPASTGPVPHLEVEWPYHSDTTPFDLARKGDTLYAVYSDPVKWLYYLQTVDIGGLPEVVTELDWQYVAQGGVGTLVHNPGPIEVVGDRLYWRMLPRYTNAVPMLWVFDISERVPRHLYTINHSYASRVLVSAGYADYAPTPDGWVYVASYPDRAVLICDCRDDESGETVGQIDTCDDGGSVRNPRTVAVAGDQLYVEVTDDAGQHLAVYDISNRASPERLSQLCVSEYGGAPVVNNLRCLCDGDAVAFVSLGGVPRLWVVDVRDPQELKLVGQVDISTQARPEDADAVGSQYFVHLGHATWDPDEPGPAWSYYAYQVHIGEQSGIIPIGGGVEQEAFGWLGIVGWPLSAGGGVSMFTDPRGVQWAAIVGWSGIHILRRKGGPTEWTTYAAGDVVELPESDGYDAADITGDGEVLIVLARRASSRHTYLWYSTDESTLWLGPYLLTGVA